MATIFDVAQQAGVSTGTVSRALNGHPEVSAETRQRVIAAAEALGYQPDALARGMVTRATATIGLVVPDIASPFFHELARGVEDVASAHGQLVVVCNTDRSVEKERRYLRALRAHRVGGLILAGAPHQAPPAGELPDKGAPGVLVIRRAPAGAGWPALLLDYRTAVRQEVAHLLTLGHWRIGYVNGPAAQENATARLHGYRDALRQAGVRFDRELVTAADFSIEGGYAAAARLLDLPAAPTAIALANDYMALGALQAARARGLSVPAGLSIAGFNDFVVAGLVEPRLTTVRVPLREMGARAMRVLLEAMRQRRARGTGGPEDLATTESGAPLPAEEYVETELVVRESTTPLALPFPPGSVTTTGTGDSRRSTGSRRRSTGSASRR